MKIGTTTSEFVNQILKEFRPGNSLENVVLQSKSLVRTELDKYIYNHFSEEDDKFKTSFDIVKESQNVFSRNVPDHGSANTPYGEWLRAFNKLMYRLFNDGDHILYGYFSALNFYLSHDCSTNFTFDDFGCFRFKIYDETIENANEIEETSEAFTELILALCSDCGDNRLFPEIISELISKNSNIVTKWWQLMNIMIDILDPYIKNDNKNSYMKSCDSYYKNGMDYIDHELYEFLACTCHENNWLCDNDNPESCISFRDKTEDISIIKLSSYNYEIRMDLHNFGAIFFSSFEFNLKVDSDREKVEELFSIYRRYKSNNNNIQDVITLGEFLKFYNGYKNILDKSIVIELFTKTEDGDYRELIKTFDKIQDLIDDTEFVKMYKLHKWFCPIHESEHRVLQVIVNHDNEKNS